MYKIRKAEKKDMPEVEKLTEKVFNDTFVRDVIEKEKEFDYENVRLLFDDSGKLASTVFIIPREMYYEGKILKLGGIGGVATDPEFRGKGYANFLMKDAVENMRKRKFDLSILYPFKSEYYAKFGYRDIIIPFGIIPCSTQIKTENEYEIVEIENNIEDYAKELEKLYNKFSAKLTGPIKRSKIYWLQKFEKNKRIREKFLIALKNKKIAGYLILDRIKKNWSDTEYKLKITECVWDEKEFNAVNYLVKASLEHAIKKSFNKIFYDKFYGFNLNYTRVPEDAEYNEHKNLKYIKMYKILNLKNMIDKIKDILNSRIKENFEKIIDIKHQENNLQGKIFITFIKTGNKIELDEGEFTKFFLGLANFNDLTKADLSEDEKGFLETLFSKKGPIFWDFDYL